MQILLLRWIKGTDIFTALPQLFQTKPLAAANVIADKASCVISNDTSNLAENVMSLVAKFSGGTQMNRSQRGSYQHRWYGAALDFQYGPLWQGIAWKTITGKSPSSPLKFIARREMAKKKASARKRRLEEEFASGEQAKKRKVSDHTSDAHYGECCQQPDIPAEVYKEKSLACCSASQW